MDPCCNSGSSNGGGGMATSSSSAPAGEGSSEGGDGSSKEGIRKSAKDLLSRYLDRLIAHLVRHGTVRLSILTALNVALDEGLLDPLFVMKTARDVGLPGGDIPAGRGIGPLDDRDAVLPMGPLIRVVRFLDPIDAANFARTSRLHAETVRHPLTTGGLVARSDLSRPALRAVQHLLRHSPPRFGPDSLLDRWTQGHLETLDVDFTAVIRSGHCDSRAKRVLARLGSIGESLDDSIRIVRFAKCADVGEDPVPIIRTLENSRAMAAVKSLVLDGLILEPSPQRSVRLPARMENLRRLELTQITVVRGCTLLPDNGSVVARRLSRLVIGVRPESAALEVAGALLRWDGECNLVELRVFHLTTPAAVDALAETLPTALPQMKYLEVGPWTDRLMQRVGHYTELEELSGMGSPSMATPVHVERVLAGLSKLRRLRLNAVDEDTLGAVTRGVTSSGAFVEDIGVQYSGRDSIEATLAMVRLRVTCHHVRRVQCPRANFMRTSPSTETRDRGGPLGTSVTVPGERLLGEEFQPRLVCNCARCLLHGGPESEDHYSRNVAAVWSLLTPAERTCQRRKEAHSYRQVPTLPAVAEEGDIEMDDEFGPETLSSASTDGEKLPVFDMSPVNCRCPFCRADITTFVTHEPSVVSYLLALLLILVLQWLSVCVLPVIWPLLKDTVHRCPSCLNKVGARSKISLPTNFKNDVLTFRIGHCAVVLARKLPFGSKADAPGAPVVWSRLVTVVLAIPIRYVVILLALVGVIGVFYMARSSGVMQPTMIPRGPDIDVTWKDFLSDCGDRAYLGNPLHSVKAFDEKYKYKTVKWTGRVVRIREGIDLWLFKTKSFAMIKMFPPQQAYRPDVVDLILLFDGAQQRDQVALLPAGAWAEFEASLLSLGRRGGPHLLQLWSIKETERPQEVEDAVAEAAMALSARQVGLHSRRAPLLFSGDDGCASG
ncbi:hypothetical protein FOZ63_011492 [Perkinsus olseni]|uniref:LITAF domain-containing protein n=1 Tax=Perkinsus olseni TaxID=32597 RepID=A0A7J6R2T3_PEROL|nr:hypothetical protein FOZ63_011492 [Perkinsus olseni]